MLGLHAHLNSIFAHIIEYNFFYHTLEDKEIEVLQVGSILKTSEVFKVVIQDLVHALKLAPDKSSINTSSCSEDTAKEQSAAEPEEIPKDQTAKEPEEAVKEAETGAESESEKEEAVNNCDEKNDEKSVTAEVEKLPFAGILKWRNINAQKINTFFLSELSVSGSENKSASDEEESKT